MGKRFKINERAGATLTALAMLVMLLASPILVVLGEQVTAAQAGVEVTFGRWLSGDRVGQHKVPPLASVTMTITATASSHVENAVLADYFPSDWTVVDANGGIVSIHDGNYNKIEWNVGTVNDSVSRSYVIRSPQLTLPPSKYYFRSELTYSGESAVRDDWMVIVADPPDQETLRPNAAGTYQEWYLSDTSHWGATSDQIDTTYIYENVVGERDIENLDDPTFGDSDTINWVQINFRVYSSGSAPPEKALNIYRVDGTDYQDIKHTITQGSWNDYMGSQLGGPGGVGSWTKAQVTALEAGVKADTVDGAELIRVSEIWVVVDYTPAAVLGKPALYLPADGTVTNDNTPYFEWENGTNADNHRLLVDNDPDFSSPEENRIVLDNNYTIADENSLPDDNYSWKVIAINAQGENESAETWTLVVDTQAPSAPTLVLPENNAVGSNLTQTFTWSEPEPGVTYDIQIDNETSFASLYVHENIGLADNSYIYTFASDGVYYWRARAVDAANNQSSWADNFKLTIQAPPGQPVLYLPENATKTYDNTPYFEWENGTNAENHRLVVDNDPNFADGENAIDNTIIGDNSFTPTTELPLDNYYWKVCARNAQGDNWSDNMWTFEVVVGAWDLIEAWTGTVEAPITWQLIETWTGTIQAPAAWQLIETWTGTVEAPAAWQLIETWTGVIGAPVYPSKPTLYLPADGTTTDDTTPTFDWSDVTDPSGVTYTLEIIGTLTKTGLATSTYTLTSGEALSDGDYSWRVRAIDNAGNVGDWSNTWSLTVSTAPPPPPPPPPPPAPDFSISVSPTSDEVVQGSSTTATVTVTAIEGYSYTVDLTASGQPSGVTVTFSPDNGTPSSDSTLTMSVGRGAPTGTYTITITGTGEDGKIRSTTYGLTITLAPPEIPISSVDAITPYWQTATPFTITATASDNDGYLTDVALWYRYSTNNSSWDSWTLFGVDSVEPWSWSFTAPKGDGYYEFHSISKDDNSNEEPAKIQVEARCGVDRTAPPAIQLVSPADTAMTDETAPTFNWADITDLSGVAYELVVDDSSDFSSPVLSKVGLTTSVYQLSVSEALAEGTYHWRVRAIDGAGNVGGWTDAWLLVVRVEIPTVTIGPIPASGTVTADFTSYRIFIVKVSITVTQDVIDAGVSALQITVEEFAGSPEQVAVPSGVIYPYFGIVTTNVTAANISSTEVEFRVLRSWIEQNDIDEGTIKLFRYSSGWQRLSTRAVRADSTYLYYEATTSGFTLFAAAGEKRVPPAVPIVFYVLLSLGVALGGSALAYRLYKLKRPPKPIHEPYFILKRLEKAVGKLKKKRSRKSSAEAHHT